jgi:hypothetical protein|tara:strand:+ start:181 stop:285 length:105 start_codon:yes stop_codon:yes gene_type:complete
MEAIRYIAAKDIVLYRVEGRNVFSFLRLADGDRG